MDFKKIKKIHLVGMGGIGVSAVARMFLDKGKQISGSDLSESKIIEELIKLGAKFSLDHQADNLEKDVDLVVYSPAVPESNPEIMAAKALKIPTLSYPQALGLCSQNHSLIAVAGTHGKTTTTAMVAGVLINDGLDPTVIVGSLFKKPKTNYLCGRGKYFIAEACEYKRSFLSLKPHILIITNIDLDHLDYYKDLADIQSAFSELVSKMSEDDYLICDAYHKNLEPVVASARCQVVDYKNISREGLKLKIPGEHNLENAQSVLALAEVLKIGKQKAIDALNSFEGTWRRSEYRGEMVGGVKIYDDYAHNPTEVSVTLKGFRDFFPNKNIMVVFQPHLYSRTKIFLKEFAKSFGSVDEVIILPIYAARESFDESINSEMLVEEIKKYKKEVFFAHDFTSAVKRINEIKSKDMVITMGAGDVWKVGEMFLENINFNNSNN